MHLTQRHQGLSTFYLSIESHNDCQTCSPSCLACMQRVGACFGSFTIRGNRLIQANSPQYLPQKRQCLDSLLRKNSVGCLHVMFGYAFDTATFVLTHRKGHRPCTNSFGLDHSNNVHRHGCKILSNKRKLRSCTIVAGERRSANRTQWSLGEPPTLHAATTLPHQADAAQLVCLLV